MRDVYILLSCYSLAIVALIALFFRLYATVTDIFRQNKLIISQNIKIMTTQEQLDTLVQGIATDLTGVGTDITGIGTAVGGISSGLATLIANGISNGGKIDFTGLQALQTQADGAKASLDQTAAQLGTLAASVAAAVAPPAQATGTDGTAAAAGTN